MHVTASARLKSMNMIMFAARRCGLHGREAPARAFGMNREIISSGSRVAVMLLLEPWMSGSPSSRRLKTGERERARIAARTRSSFGATSSAMMERQHFFSFPWRGVFAGVADRLVHRGLRLDFQNRSNSETLGPRLLRNLAVTASQLSLVMSIEDLARRPAGGGPPTCMLTSLCMDVARKQPVLVHAMLDNMLGSELPSSWLHAVIRDRVLDCSGGIRPSTHRPVWRAGPFAPDMAAGGNMSEILFMHLRSDHFQKVKRVRLPLVSCAPLLDAHEIEHEGLQFVWMGPQKEPPTPTFGRALRLLSPEAAVVVSMSYIPDVGRAFPEIVAGVLQLYKIESPQRTLVLHYRAGRLREPQWRCPRSPFFEMRRRGEAGGSVAPIAQEAFWNSFWRRLSYVAREEHSQQLCSDSAPGKCDPATALAQWCAKPLPPIAMPPPLPASPMLMLGGDAHYNRELYVMRMHAALALVPRGMASSYPPLVPRGRYVMRMHAAGLLDRAMWSLQTPPQCAHLRRMSTRLMASWAPFCRVFPKRLDKPLHGPLEESNKVDRTPTRAPSPTRARPPTRSRSPTSRYTDPCIRVTRSSPHISLLPWPSLTFPRASLLPWPSLAFAQRDAIPTSFATGRHLPAAVVLRADALLGRLRVGRER